MIINNQNFNPDLQETGRHRLEKTRPLRLFLSVFLENQFEIATICQ